MACLNHLRFVRSARLSRLWLDLNDGWAYRIRAMHDHILFNFLRISKCGQSLAATDRVFNEYVSVENV